MRSKREQIIARLNHLRVNELTREVEREVANILPICSGTFLVRDIDPRCFLAEQLVDEADQSDEPANPEPEESRRYWMSLARLVKPQCGLVRCPAHRRMMTDDHR